MTYWEDVLVKEVRRDKREAFARSLLCVSVLKKKKSEKEVKHGSMAALCTVVTTLCFGVFVCPHRQSFPGTVPVITCLLPGYSNMLKPCSVCGGAGDVLAKVG